MAKATDIMGVGAPAAQAVVLSRAADYSADDIASADAPTLAEINAAFGTAAACGAGFMGIIDDAGAGSNSVLCWSDGTNWFYEAGGKAS